MYCSSTIQRGFVASIRAAFGGQEDVWDFFKGTQEEITEKIQKASKQVVTKIREHFDWTSSLRDTYGQAVTDRLSEIEKGEKEEEEKRQKQAAAVATTSVPRLCDAESAKQEEEKQEEERYFRQFLENLVNTDFHEVFRHQDDPLDKIDGKSSPHLVQFKEFRKTLEKLEVDFKRTIRHVSVTKMPSRGSGGGYRPKRQLTQEGGSDVIDLVDDPHTSMDEGILHNPPAAKKNKTSENSRVQQQTKASDNSRVQQKPKASENSRVQQQTKASDNSRVQQQTKDSKKSVALHQTKASDNFKKSQNHKASHNPQAGKKRKKDKDSDSSSSSSSSEEEDYEDSDSSSSSDELEEEDDEDSDSSSSSGSSGSSSSSDDGNENDAYPSDGEEVPVDNYEEPKNKQTQRRKRNIQKPDDDKGLGKLVPCLVKFTLARASDTDTSADEETQEAIDRVIRGVAKEVINGLMKITDSERKATEDFDFDKKNKYQPDKLERILKKRILCLLARDSYSPPKSSEQSDLVRMKRIVAVLVRHVWKNPIPEEFLKKPTTVLPCSGKKDDNFPAKVFFSAFFEYNEKNTLNVEVEIGKGNKSPLFTASNYFAAKQNKQK